MRIALSFESETVPDYVRGETKAEDRILEINFDGERLESYSEYMDDYDKKEAVGCIRSVLNLYEKKEELKR